RKSLPMRCPVRHRIIATTTTMRWQRQRPEGSARAIKRRAVLRVAHRRCLVQKQLRFPRAEASNVDAAQAFLFDPRRLRHPDRCGAVGPRSRWLLNAPENVRAQAWSDARPWERSVFD